MRIEEIPASPKKRKVTRVAAYARVSSDKDAAFHSLEAQTEYYQNYIAALLTLENTQTLKAATGQSGSAINMTDVGRRSANPNGYQKPY